VKTIPSAGAGECRSRRNIIPSAGAAAGRVLTVAQQEDCDAFAMGSHTGSEFDTTENRQLIQELIDLEMLQNSTAMTTMVERQSKYEEENTSRHKLADKVIGDPQVCSEEAKYGVSYLQTQVDLQGRIMDEMKIMATGTHETLQLHQEIVLKALNDSKADFTEMTTNFAAVDLRADRMSTHIESTRDALVAQIDDVNKFQSQRDKERMDQIAEMTASMDEMRKTISSLQSQNASAATSTPVTSLFGARLSASEGGPNMDRGTAPAPSIYGSKGCDSVLDVFHSASESVGRSRSHAVSDYGSHEHADYDDFQGSSGSKSVPTLGQHFAARMGLGFNINPAPKGNSAAQLAVMRRSRTQAVAMGNIPSDRNSLE